MALKTCNDSVQLQMKMRKISRHRPRGRRRRTWSFYVVVLQRTAKKCTKSYNARAQLLFCSLNLLFSDVLVAVVLVVCLGPVHTNPFSNENGAACFAPFSKRFASTLIVFVSFSPIHTTTPYPFENAFIPSVRILKWTRRMRISIYRPGKLAPFSILCWRPVVSIWMTSPFSDCIVFTVHTRKQRFQKASFSNRSTLESVFEWLRFRWSFSAL